jgi:hypothetical protein
MYLTLDRRPPTNVAGMNRCLVGGLTWVGWIGVSALLVACGKGGEKEDRPASISQEELPARAAAIRCEGMSRCCEGSGFPFDVTPCQQKQTGHFENLIAQFAANVGYDARAAGEYLEALETGNNCGRLDEQAAAAWERAFPGKLELGQPCGLSQECRQEPGQTVSCFGDGTTPQVCTLVEGEPPTRHGQAGETCSRTCESDRCPVNVMSAMTTGCYRTEGLWCDFVTEQPTCSRLPELGQACPSGECTIGSFCATDTRVCTALRATGQPCLRRDECKSGYCEEQDPSRGTGASEPAQTYCVAQQPVAADDCRREYD